MSSSLNLCSIFLLDVFRIWPLLNACNVSRFIPSLLRRYVINKTFTKFNSFHSFNHQHECPLKFWGWMMYIYEQNGILKFRKAHVCPQQFFKNQLTPVEPLKCHEICMFLTLQIMGHIPKNQSDIPITLFTLCCFKRCNVQSLLQNWGLDQPPNSLMGF
jgi:hypothetical protein